LRCLSFALAVVDSTAFSTLATWEGRRGGWAGQWWSAAVSRGLAGGGSADPWCGPLHPTCTRQAAG
jgi:hypothetical protein